MPQDNKIKIRRGLDANLPDFNTEIGELRYSTDTKKLYIDDGTANRYIGGDVNAFPISTATQTALNNKQDVLTEDNVGQLMDSELSMKSVPTSGDTVLARDILTNKAVEIPIESLGGGGSGLELGETSSTAYRGDRGKIAYDHSQVIGNPHNTKVEELSDVSGTDTTIVDTDVILKKETGGFWRKITWANIKSALKTYFDSIYAPKAFNLKITTPSSWVTGTTSETEVLRIEIPANSLSDSDVLRIPFLMINKVGTAGTIFIRGKLSTSTTMPSGTTDQLFQTAIVAATNKFVGLDRSFIIDDGKIKGFHYGIPSYTSSTISSNPISQKPFDRTVTNYLYISITLGNTSDQARLEGMQLTNS